MDDPHPTHATATSAPPPSTSGSRLPARSPGRNAIEAAYNNDVSLRDALGRALDAAPPARAVAPTINSDGMRTAADDLLALTGTARPVA